VCTTWTVPTAEHYIGMLLFSSREQFVYSITNKLYWHFSVYEALFISHHSTYWTVIL